MCWYKLEADLAATDIQDRFVDLFMSLGGPKGMALFGTLDVTNPHVFYFSPECEKHIKAFMEQLDCERSEKPEKDSLALLVGHDSDWEELF